MKTKKQQTTFWIGGCLLAAFAAWTLLVCTVDVAPIGPHDSCVGFATLNRFVWESTGVHMWLYTVTDWLSIIPLATVAGFGVLGLLQWIRRKRLSRMDRSLLALWGFYAAVLAAFVLFEFLEVNFRPILIEGQLEASYPSSTTMLVLCVMPTAIMQWNTRIQTRALRRTVTVVTLLFIVFMVIGRLLSGVHWFSDIIGGALLSAGLVMLYRGAATSTENN